MAGKVKGIEIEIGGNTIGLSKALNSANKDINTTQKELRQVERLLKLDPNNTELLAQKQQLLAEQTEKVSEKLAAMKDAKDKADQAMAEGTEVNEQQYRALQREIISCENSLSAMKETVNDLGSTSDDTYKTLDKIADTTQKFGEKATDIGKKMLPVSAGIGAVGAASIALGSQFEDAFAKVLTIADTTEVPVNEFKKSIKNLSDETGIEATAIADNVYNAISAGQKTGDAVNFVSNAVKLSKAGFADSGAALDILTTAMNAYGLEASAVTNVSDLLIQTQNLGKTTVAELSSAMGKVIPTAKANNVELDQLCAGYSILTAKGIATADSTTYMNSMLNELGKGGTNVDKILREKTGLSFSQLSEKGNTLGDILSILEQYAKESNKSFSDLWSSSEAGKAALVLLGDGANDFNTRLDEMKNAAGATEEAFGKLNTNSEIAKKAINQIKNVGAELGETILSTLQPIIETVAEKIKEFSEWFSGLSESAKTAIVVIGGIVAAIGPVLVIVGQMASGVSALIGVIKTASTVMGILNAVMAANPIGAVIAVVAALVAGFVLLWNKCEGFRNFWINLWETIKNAVSTAVDFVKENWKQITLFLVNPIAGVIAFLYKLNPQFREWVNNLIASIKQWFGKMADVGEYIIKGIWNGIGNTVEWLKGKVKGVVNTIKGWFTGKDGFDEHSPSKWGEQVGRFIPEGIAIGIEGSSKEVNKTFTKMLDDLNLKKDLYVIDEKEYYNELGKLRDKYLKKGTKDWWQYTKQIIEYEGKREKEAFEKELESLKLQKETKKLSEAEYYNELGKLRDKYFDDSEDEWQKYTNEIVKYNAKALEEAKKQTISVYEKMAEESGKKIDEVNKKRDSLADKLLDGRNLYETKTISLKSGDVEGMRLTDWSADIDALNAYNDTMLQTSERVKEKFGEDTAEFNEFMELVRKGSVKESMQISNLLLSANDKELEEYINGWKEVQRLSRETSSNIYADEASAVQTEFLDSLSKSLDSLPEEFKTCGETAAQFFGDGFIEKIQNVLADIQTNIKNITVDMLPNTVNEYRTSINNSKSNIFNITNNSTSRNSAVDTKKALNSFILQGVL